MTFVFHGSFRFCVIINDKSSSYVAALFCWLTIYFIKVTLLRKHQKGLKCFFFCSNDLTVLMQIMSYFLSCFEVLFVYVTTTHIRNFLISCCRHLWTNNFVLNLSVLFVYIHYLIQLILTRWRSLHFFKIFECIINMKFCMLNKFEIFPKTV